MESGPKADVTHIGCDATRIQTKNSLFAFGVRSSRALIMMRNSKTSRDRRATIAERILLWISSGKVVDGLWVGAEADAERVLPRVEEALNLIKTHDPQRYNHIVRDLERVWVRLLTAGAAQFNPGLWACMLDERFVLAETTDTAMIAAVIVHEATHARLWRRGFGYDEDERQRIETICIRREMAFARRLPDGQRLREFAHEALATAPSYWTNAASHDRHIEGSVEALRYLGWSWLARPLLAIRKWRSKKVSSREDGQATSAD